MRTTEVSGAELEHELTGSGDPVVLVHGGLLADENRLLSRSPVLTDAHQVLHYHRRGYAESSRTGASSVEEQAADCLELVHRLGLGPVHLVGHSLGGAICLQAALDEPSSVRSLTLLEPAIMSQIAKVSPAHEVAVGESQRQFDEAFSRVLAIAATGDTQRALLAFVESRAGASFRDVLDVLTSTGGFDHAIRDADTLLTVEMPAAFRWVFTPAEAAAISQPVLSVLGAHSSPRARLVHDVLCRWVPQTQLAVLPDAEHALPLLDPDGTAAALTAFLRSVQDATAPAAPHAA